MLKRNIVLLKKITVLNCSIKHNVIIPDGEYPSQEFNKLLEHTFTGARTSTVYTPTTHTWSENFATPDVLNLDFSGIQNCQGIYPRMDNSAPRQSNIFGNANIFSSGGVTIISGQGQGLSLHGVSICGGNINIGSTRSKNIVTNEPEINNAKSINLGSNNKLRVESKATTEIFKISGNATFNSKALISKEQVKISGNSKINVADIETTQLSMSGNSAIKTDSLKIDSIVTSGNSVINASGIIVRDLNTSGNASLNSTKLDTVGNIDVNTQIEADLFRAKSSDGIGKIDIDSSGTISALNGYVQDYSVSVIGQGFNGDFSFKNCDFTNIEPVEFWG